MPQINTNRPIERVELTHGAWADVDTGPIVAGDVLELDTKDSQATQGVKVFAGRIKAWNYVDENDKPLPITFEMVRLIPAEDLALLAEKIKLDSVAEPLPEAENLTSSATSQAEPTTTAQGPSYQ